MKKLIPIFLIVLSCFFFSLLGAIIKYLSEEIHPFEQAFFRNFISIFLFIPLIISNKKIEFKSNRKIFLLLRSFFGATTMILLFWSYSLIPLSQAMAISFSTPLFIFLGSIIFFKEKPSRLDYLVLLTGFILTSVIIRPDLSINIGSYIALFAAITHAITGLMVKNLTKTETVFTIMFFMVLFMSPLTFIPATYVWQTPNNLEIWFGLFLLALVGSLGNFCWTKSISLSPMTKIMPFDFSKLIFATIIGFIFFDEKLDKITFIAGAILILCNLILIRKKKSK